MSSATSIDPSTGPSRELRAGPSTGSEVPDATLRPWQFFLLAGMLSATGVVIVATGQSPASIILLSLTVIAASLVALGTYRALAPLVVPEDKVAPPVTVGPTRAALEREKSLVLRSIKELEFDYAMGKIARSDFDEISGKLRARAIGLMRRLDEGGEGYRSVIEQELEKRIAGLRSQATDSAHVARDFSPAISPAPTCDCGVANDPDARFCKNCGSRLPGAA